MYKSVHSIKSLQEILESNPGDSIFLGDENIQKENLDIFERSFVFGRFFISENIAGELYETSEGNLFFLTHKNKTFFIITSHYDALLVKHYHFTLLNDIECFQKYHTLKNISYCSTAIDIYIKQVDAYGESSEHFIKTFSPREKYSYNYIQSWKNLISIYASLRSSFQGNAESWSDSKESNSFLLLGKDPITVSKYIREKTWVTTEYEAYMRSILNFYPKEQYNLTLTTSGMSALNLVIRYLSTKKVINILIIGEIYFENTLVIYDHFGEENIHFMPINKVGNDIGKYIKQHSIEAIFIDSISISFASQVFTQEDFITLTDSLSSYACNTDIIIDSTTRYTGLLDYAAPENYKNNIFLIGSLIKHLSGGIDITTGGYILTPRPAIELCDHIPRIDADIGTVNALKIPILPRSYHENIIKRIAQCIQNTQNSWKKQEKLFPHICVQFPRSFNSSQKENRNFHGCLINIALKNKDHILKLFPKYSNEIQAAIMQTAKNENINVSYSIGYGYYNTRIVIFSLDKVCQIYDLDTPYYIRISVGYTSNSIEVTKLLGVTSKILTFFEKKYC